MNAVAQTFAIAFASVAAAATIGIGLANSNAEPSTDVAKLERVVVVGQRAQVAVVAKPPRVLVEKRAAEPTDLTMAQAHPVRSL